MSEFPAIGHAALAATLYNTSCGSALTATC